MRERRRSSPERVQEKMRDGLDSSRDYRTAPVLPAVARCSGNHRSPPSMRAVRSTLPLARVRPARYNAGMPSQLTLVLGGARSGKSHYAEQLAAEHADGPVTYIATAQAGDEEMALRIALHRARRPESWKLVEEPVMLGDALYGHATQQGCVLVDCVTLWLNNLLFGEHHTYPETGLITPPAIFTEQIEALISALQTAPGKIILVSNEIGLGIVPMGAMTRFYVDELGRLNQRLAAQADTVRLMVAGMPVVVKG